ncbi:MAG: ATP-dependent DNA helicase RecQ, partial [Lachnospiraceae bacterium]|nr:ATP-dependent DNA helicase RecQ [Lachnospiraceae bacterium]
MTAIHETLKTYFGYDTFRPGQEKLITTLLSGRDVLGIMPTGAGKSLCYQIPALTFPGLTIVVSPLISLMQDQVQTLLRRGIRAEYINSAIPPGKRREILNDILNMSKSPESGPAVSFQDFSGNRENAAAFPSALPQYTDVRSLQDSIPVKNVCSLQDSRPVRNVRSLQDIGPVRLLYVSPERLTSDEFRAFAKSARISFVCVDEAHCISQWGMQFRPDYLKIAEFAQMLPKRPVIGAFTATANTEVRDDIIDRLCLRNPYVLTTGFDRPNLFFEVRRTRDKWTDLTALLKKHRGECGIIYCLTRRTVESLSKKLCLSGFPVTHYHGGMSLADRESSQSDWLCGRRNVIVATNAFGMGIDKG